MNPLTPAQNFLASLDATPKVTAPLAMNPTINNSLSMGPVGTYPTGNVGGGSVQGAATTGPSQAQIYAQQQAAAQAAAKAKADAVARQNFNSGRDSMFGSIDRRLENEGVGIRSGILDQIEALRNGQNSIDTSAVNNELGKKQGMSGVMNMVSNGLRSGGVILANKNASNSSAPEALARAYSLLGRQSASEVGNKYEIANNNIRAQQTNLDNTRATTSRKYQDQKSQLINSIIDSATTQMEALNTSMVNASLPDRIAIEQEKNNIRNKALGQLQQFDNLLQSEMAGVKASDANTRLSKAQELANAGTAASGEFDYTSAIPAELQNTGPFEANLPIFTFNRNKKLV